MNRHKVYFTTFLLLILMIKTTVSSQSLNESSIKQKIDSLIRTKELNQKKIDSLNFANKIIEDTLKRKKEQLLDLSNEELSGETITCIESSVLLESPNDIDWKIIINKGDKAKVIGVLNDYYKISFRGNAGFVLKTKFHTEKEAILSDSLKRDKANKLRLIEAEKKEKIKELEIEQNKTEEARKNELLKKYGTQNGLKIFEGKIWIGMSKEMLLESWGKPNDINRTVGAWGVHEQWVYPGQQYLYLENDVLKSWQD